MRSLYENAIDAIQMGVEDYQANDPRRATSAVRNFYAGTLLLAKEALRKAAPDADPDLMIAARVKLMPDGSGGAEAVPADRNTLDFSTIGLRLKDFDIPVDMAALRDLNRIRTDIEHAAGQRVAAHRTSGLSQCRGCLHERLSANQAAFVWNHP